MKQTIAIRHLVSGAQQATGLTVIIDVLRAFSVVCYAFGRGVEMIIPVAEIGTAFALQREHPDFLLMGERGGYKVAGFDFGNSPSEIATADLSGKTLVHTTSHGTQGLVNARQATEVITGSFVNAPAIVRYVAQRTPQTVTLVGMGVDGREAIEDTLCAEYLRDCLRGGRPDFAAIAQTIRDSGRVARFLDPAEERLPAADVDLCLRLGVFDFVLRAEPYGDGLLALSQVAVD